MRRRAAQVLLGAVCLLAARRAEAHPIHTTLTAVTVAQGGITLSIRAFADDFSAVVAAMAGKRPAADWAVDAVDVSRYLAANVRVLDSRGQPLVLQACGVRREREVYWLCLRIDGATDLRPLRAENRMLTERHADQVNIVQVDATGIRKTLLFTKGTRALPLTG
jgi:hypothetical protein